MNLRISFFASLNYGEQIREDAEKASQTKHGQVAGLTTQMTTGLENITMDSCLKEIAGVILVRRMGPVYQKDIDQNGNKAATLSNKTFMALPAREFNVKLK
jgi:hypothetical protein